MRASSNTHVLVFSPWWHDMWVADWFGPAREKQSDQRGRGSEKENKQAGGERERGGERALSLWLDGFNSHSKGQTYNTWERDSLFLSFICGSTTVSLQHAQHIHTHCCKNTVQTALLSPPCTHPSSTHLFSFSFSSSLLFFQRWLQLTSLGLH